MTSYSLYSTSRIRLVDGTLSPHDDERREEDIGFIALTVAAGMTRALLDVTRDLADEDAEVAAVHWHSADEGWELNAIVDADRPALVSLADTFVRDNLDRVLTLASHIAWDPRWSTHIWALDQGMAIYRVGMLLGHRLAGTGIGFDDYYSTDVEQTVIALDAWVIAGDHEYKYEETWVDSNESPTLLHLHI